jgi:hypothetical protein
MICLIILMIIEAIVIAVTVAQCGAHNDSNSVACQLQPWALVYPRLIGIIVFCVVAAIISCTLAALWRDAYRDRSAC